MHKGAFGFRGENLKIPKSLIPHEKVYPKKKSNGQIGEVALPVQNSLEDVAVPVSRSEPSCFRSISHGVRELRTIREKGEMGRRGRTILSWTRRP